MTSYFAAPKGASTLFTPTRPGSLNNAISRARPGDEIVLTDGLYRQLVRFKRSGAPDKPILLRAEHPQQAIIEMPGGVKEGKFQGNNSCINTKPYSYITISGLTINGRQWGESGITADDGSNIIIEFNHIRNTGSGGVGMKGLEDSVIRFNLIEDTGRSFLGEGIYLGQVRGDQIVKNIEVYGNTVRRCCMNFVDMKLNNENVNIHHNLFEDLVPGRNRPDLGAGLASDGLILMGGTKGAGCRCEDNILRNVTRDRPAQIFKISQNSGHIVQRNLVYNVNNQRLISGHQNGTMGKSVITLNTFHNLVSKLVNDQAGPIGGIDIVDNKIDATEQEAHDEEQRIISEMQALAAAQYQSDPSSLNWRSPTLLFV